MDEPRIHPPPAIGTEDRVPLIDRIDAQEVERAILAGDIDVAYGLWLLGRLATRPRGRSRAS